MPTVASVSVDLKANSAAFNKGMRDAKNSLDGLKNQLQGFNSVTQLLKGGGAAIGITFLAHAVRDGAAAWGEYQAGTLSAVEAINKAIVAIPVLGSVVEATQAVLDAVSGRAADKAKAEQELDQGGKRNKLYLNDLKTIGEVREKAKAADPWAGVTAARENRNTFENTDAGGQLRKQDQVDQINRELDNIREHLHGKEWSVAVDGLTDELLDARHALAAWKDDYGASSDEDQDLARRASAELTRHMLTTLIDTAKTSEFAKTLEGGLGAIGDVFKNGVTAYVDSANKAATEATEHEAESIAKYMKDQAREAEQKLKQAMEQLKTPVEKYADTILQLHDLHLSPEKYDYAIAKAQKDLESDLRSEGGHVDKSAKRVGAVEMRHGFTNIGNGPVVHDPIKEKLDRQIQQGDRNLEIQKRQLKAMEEFKNEAVFDLTANA